MASLTTSAFLPSLRVPFLASAAALFLPQVYRASVPSIQSLLDLFPPFLLAVPKSKTSHSRKAMRSANKGLKDKNNIVNCPGCGAPKLAHHLCSNCYSFLNRAWKTKQKNQTGDDIPDMS